MNKIKLLKITLSLGAVYYIIGGFVHFFGLTLFPFYDSRLYTPYHDSVLGLVGLILALFLLAIARDPIKNKDTLKVVIIGLALASIFSIAIIWKVDFLALGAPGKRVQSIVEGVLAFVYLILLLWLYPRGKNKNY
jgi:hypothetical protein